ncbi:HD domain-containing protein [Candidatus Tisiphia endosymbiont of Ditula angustiorana]|uniref:HD domain-containing protein n=1 Tax=Candidatus Tisiphia endosymbiont of Ditula angustiorana TaxID=3066272 RepID=UPI00312CB0BB
MEGINNSWLKFESCDYADRLLAKLSQLNSEVDQPIDMNIVKKAIYYAKKYHGEQKRQTGEPYYSHPIEVAYMLAEYAAQNDKLYFRTDLTVTAILHDTIEDTKLTKSNIAYIFSDLIADQVEKLTRVKCDRKISSAEIMELLWQQKRYDIIMVKIFDRIHNLETVGIKSPKKIKKIIEETFKNFISISMCCGTKQLENILTTLCYKHLPITDPLELTTIIQHKYQLPTPTFENDINQK